MLLIVVVFVAVYLGMALGRWPGLRIDRTGIALLGAILLYVSDRISGPEALAAIDFPTLFILFGLMILSAQFAASGFYTIGNVPAVMLLLAVWPQLDTHTLYALAVFSTLAGNLLLLGSMANLIVVERAREAGVRLGFAEHARCGIPMTLASCVLAVLWLHGMGQ